MYMKSNENNVRFDLYADICNGNDYFTICL